MRGILDCLYIVSSEVTSSGLQRLGDLEDSAGIIIERMIGKTTV